MALPCPDIAAVVSGTLDIQRTFEKFARHIPDAPRGRGCQYAIRAGSKTLFSDDTYDLAQKFRRHIAALRRKAKKCT